MVNELLTVNGTCSAKADTAPPTAIWGPTDDIECEWDIPHLMIREVEDKKVPVSRRRAAPKKARLDSASSYPEESTKPKLKEKYDKVYQKDGLSLSPPSLILCYQIIHSHCSSLQHNVCAFLLCDKLDMW